jgi:poly [ADP-ribose] polymerase
LLALFDVSLGEPNELINSDYDADKLPANKHSTKGLGKHEPDRKQWVNLEDNCVVPMGELMQTGIENKSGYTLLYNEYVVYDVRQIKMRYLLKIEFDFI